MPHLLVDITPHGYGHASQTAAVINELVQLMPELRVTVRTTVPHEFLLTRVFCDFKCIPVALDFGMKMANAVDVDVMMIADATMDNVSGAVKNGAAGFVVKPLNAAAVLDRVGAVLKARHKG